MAVMFGRVWIVVENENEYEGDIRPVAVFTSKRRAQNYTDRVSRKHAEHRMWVYESGHFAGAFPLDPPPLKRGSEG